MFTTNQKNSILTICYFIKTKEKTLVKKIFTAILLKMYRKNVINM